MDSIKYLSIPNSSLVTRRMPRAVRTIYMDEVGTPDSSRFGMAQAIEMERLLRTVRKVSDKHCSHAPDPDVLTNKARMDERFAYARETVLPASMMMDVSATYVDIAERITGQSLQVTDNPREEIIAVLGGEFGLID